MKNTKRKKEKIQTELITIHLYGIFNVRTKKMLKVSLDRDEIDMELALTTDKDVVECESEVTLILTCPT